MNRKILIPENKKEIIVKVLSEHILGENYYCECGFDYEAVFNSNSFMSELVYRHQAEEIVKSL